MVSMNSSKFGCNCPKFGCIKSAIFEHLSKKNKNIGLQKSYTVYINLIYLSPLHL